MSYISFDKILPQALNNVWLKNDFLERFAEALLYLCAVFHIIIYKPIVDNGIFLFQ